MSKMGLLGAIGFSLALVSLTQIPYISAQVKKECKIESVQATGASSLLVKWEKYTGATNYFLDLRDKNDTHAAPVVVTLPASTTEKQVNGLKPGTDYAVTLKVFQFYYVICTNTYQASTVPDTSQIIFGQAMSSTSLMVQWTEVPSAKHYFLMVRNHDTGEKINKTYTDTSAMVENLQPSTIYDCYVYTINDAGHGTPSKVRTITTLVQPPAVINTTDIGQGTVRVTWEPVTDVLMYKVVVRNVDDPTSQPFVRNVSTTTLDVNGILPCTTYLISVSSYSTFLVPSEPRNLTFTTNKLKPIPAVSVDYVCTTDSATVHWVPVFGAESYSATATANDGTQLSCTSQGTSCLITGLGCERTYIVNVTPVSGNCKNILNTTSATFHTVPCAPKDLHLLRDCSSEVVVFSWEHTNNSNHYIAKAVDAQGGVQECMTEDNSCYFTHTVCGQHYYFSVYTVSGQCRSETSSTVDIRTAPCIPQNLQTSADCSSDILHNTWDHAAGALRYVVEVFGNHGNNSYYNCTTTSNSCAIPGLHCGEYLSVYITAFDDECASPRSLGPVAETVPCAPQNVTAVKECDSNSITMTWASSSALFYVAMAKDSNGVIHSCNSLALTCTIRNLMCGTNYTVYAIASNFLCNSTESEMMTISTVACPPDEVTASLDCAASEALISWRDEASVNSYTATIVDEDQRLLSCSSTTPSCRVPNLKCGQLYTATVTIHDGICQSIISQSILMESVPCGPQVTRNTDCNSLTLDWPSTRNAEGYITAISNGDQQMNYTTSEPAFSISTLDCGYNYTVKVMSFNGTCTSEPTVLHVKQTPCVPTDVMVTKNCSQSFVQVTWQASHGALSYQAVAKDSDDQSFVCFSDEPSCRLEDLACSQAYNVSVIAIDNTCSSNESSPVILRTVPCPPSQVNVIMHCVTNSAMLTWNSSPNAVSYTGKAMNSDGHSVTCDAGMNLACQLNDLQCGKEYTFTVSASDGNCESPDSDPVMRTTAPCAVQNVINTLNCSTNALNIAWAPGSIPVNYSAIAVSGAGTEHHCQTEDLNCTLSDLQCGQQYTVTVKAISSTCEGESSVQEVVNSVPCVPANVQGVVECSTNQLDATWDAAAGATSYISTLKGAGGFSSTCASNGLSCMFPDLQCAQTYMLSVVAVNDRCNSSESTTISAITAPCDPTNVMADLHCLTGVVTVTWEASAGANSYTVLAEANGRFDSCRSTTTSCELTQMHCGEDYTVTVLAGDGKCNSSILAKTNVTTAPCAPVIQGHSLDCATNHAVVTWVEDEDAAVVMVNATSNMGHSTSCSSSTDSNCVLNDLQCGNTYTVHAVARGAKCLSEQSSSFEIVTAPCTPANVEYSYSCETGIALLSWDESLGRKSFYATVTSGNDTAICNTTQTDCSLPSLSCGQTYMVKVWSVADHCNSHVPGETEIQTAPCAPKNLSTSLVCNNNTVAVSWKPSPGAVSYQVMANGRDGDVKQCTTNDTSCSITGMHCAQTYVVTVTPFSKSCRGFTSYPHTYIAGPCPPTDVRVSLQCARNLGRVTWVDALQADLYVATATHTHTDDHNHTCTSSGAGCTFTDLHCSEEAEVRVVTIERGCMSEPSRPFTFRTVPCPPSGLTGVTTCANNDITVSWDTSPENDATYFIHSHEEDGANANYTTTQTSHVLTGLQCGELYTLAVAVNDNQCTSNLSEPIQTETAPCPPTDLTARADCGTNLGTLNWSPSIHAISYVATVTGNHGHVVTCSSNTTTCSVKLHCGHQYTAVVIASSATCNSSTGASLTFDSAPCLPDNVMAVLDCNANTFAVQWGGNTGDFDSYTAIAIGSDGSRVTCNTTTTECTIQNLKCGLNYSIAVTTSSINCGTIDGSDYTILSAPCKLENVRTNLTCSTNIVEVIWENSGPDQDEVVSAVNSQGVTTTCNSTTSNCTFENLSCGETYSINVVGHTDTCSSQPAFAPRFNTAPCVPTHVTARVDCMTGITGVTWDAASGATSYVVYARSDLGSDMECINTDTNCDFPNLECGQVYTVTVVARHDSCVSLVSESINVTTVPCPLSDLQATLDCDTNTAVVSWTPGRGILNYNATAENFAITPQQSCSTDGSSCNITSLHCGESYNVKVSGQGQNCPSPPQEWQRIMSAPCPPTQLTVASSCESNDISVSWQASQGSVSYMAMAVDAEGNQWSCNTTSTTCQISDLPCGQQYHVYAVGVDEKCMGSKSNIEVFRTAPCVPQNVQNDLDCLSGVLNITWESTGHVVQFHASVVSSQGHASSCNTDKNYCVVSNLQCGLTYDVTVLAEDEACNSSTSPAKQVLTAPCPLSTFVPTVNCATGVVSVTWDNSVAGVVYTVTAVDTAGHHHNCSGTTSGCSLSTLECGTNYNITITPSRDGCVGRDSPMQVITTVPCVPHLIGVEIDCLTNSGWVLYEESASAESYVISYYPDDASIAIVSVECNSTSDNTCSLPSLPCSKNFTFTIQAVDSQCSSANSNAFTTETAPCPPEDLQKEVICDNNTISVSWSPVPGAVTYTATLEHVNEGTSCCTTSGTSCDISDLPCGELYILLVMAEGRTCNSSQSEGDIVRTAPCIPQNLSVSLSCSDNVASATWDYNKGLGSFYRVKAVADDGHMHECSSPENHCDLTDLHCGEYYTVTVQAEDRDCMSKPSDSVRIKTVPCTPASVGAVVDCEANALIVSWSESAGADSYIATVEDSNTHVTSCQGTVEGSCNVTGLGCGLIYHVSMVSSDGYCDSQPTTVIDISSVPCKPRHIKAVMDCYTRTALVAWFSSGGAVSYVVTAISASGHNDTCETIHSSCEMEGLLCGQSYSISVKALGETCSSISYMEGELVTEPCIPEHVTIQYSMTIGQVQWDVTAGADFYTVEGLTAQGSEVSCNTTDTNCPLYNMGCGQMYNISVTANNEVCQGLSTSTEPVSLMTEPCPPQNVETNVQCQNDVGTVSWETSTGAVAYETSLAGRDGHSLSCYTNETFCDVTGLHCGVVYYVSVTAIGQTLNSSASNTVLLTAAPCTAGDVEAHMDCDNDTAEITWSFARGADSYMVTALATNGHRATCVTEEDHCDLNNLQCGETYMVSLTTIDENCQIETLTNVTFSTRPCKPLRVGVDMDCGTSTASMYWEEAEGVEFYIATATYYMGMILQCNSTNSTCQFSNLNCGETYEFSVTAYSSMCYSETSNTVEIQTGPCQPTGLTESGSCDNDTVMLGWLAADGALRYVVTATGNLGYVDALQTTETTATFQLPCGQEFTFTVMAQDNRCDSAVSMFRNLKTGPCMPQDVQSFTHCENNLGMVTWAKSDGAETYIAVAVGEDSHTHVCTTDTTNCTWDDLHCGDHYTVHVIALDEFCTSMPSNSTAQIRMAPCIPQMVESQMNCTIKVASMSWNASETATSYIATAQTNSGHKVEVTTNDTWTFFSELQCGQEYFLSVQASDSVCTSQPSQPSKLYSEPCSPTGVSSHMNCIFNIAAVSWTGSAGADFYTATVTQRDGQSLSCYSDDEQCGIPNVPCGQNYTVTVLATHGDCQSDPSEPDMLQSVPCIPTDVAVKLDCSTDQAAVSWSASDGALFYNVTAVSTQGEISHCETSNQICTLTKLVCGQSYTVQVVASDNICSSLPSPATHFKTAPCTPIPLSVVLDCFTNSALFEWAFTEGAVNYTATAQSSSGHVSTCTTNITNCELQNLQCGEIYDVITVASNEECSSPSSTSLQVESVPCAPEGVEFQLTCSTNQVRVLWEASRGADTYIVQAFGVEEDIAGCETSTQSCIVPDLMCGFTYNISVLAVNSVCNVSRSEIKQLQAVPCVPQQVEARVVCESGVVAVSWEPSKGATSYTTVAQGNGGYASTCNSSQTTCEFDDLLCGLSYSVTVSALDETCSSAESSAVEINTVPCVPPNVTAEMVCSNDTGVVSWEEEEGVSSYMVQAFGPDGHKPTCSSTTTSCQLSDMHCGQLYNLTVTAKDEQCDSKHAYLNLQSVPCKPTNVKASLQCHLNTAAVTWERASGALSYLAVGVTADGSHSIECVNTETHCDLSDLQCGQTYNVSVFSKDESCSSVESDQAYMRTVPCAPQNVAVDSQCAAGAMSVSWSPNPDAQYFHVLAVSNTGARLHCNSSDNSCTLSDLPCGQSYNVTVLSVRDGCESKPSAVVETSSAPCPPRNAKSRRECITDGVWVTWDFSEGAVSYFVQAVEAGGHNSSCTTTESHCQVPDLKCATRYTLKVYAVNDYCHSSQGENTTLEIETGPCALTAVNATTECNSDTIFVEWDPTHDTPIYLVSAEGQDDTFISCNSTTTSCELTDVRCDMHYKIIVIASSDKCSSIRSKPRKITTAPCPPQNVTVEPSCEENGVTVSWGQSPVATSYYLVATASDGHSTSCNTTVNNCTLSDLHCGQMYLLSVVAKGENCTSAPSTLFFQAVPCDPTGLTVTVDCETNSASLSWDASQGAVEYFACAQSLDGDALYCNSTVNSCTIEGLECGDIYNFSVEASNSVCNSSFSPPVEKGAGPCPPSGLKVRMQRIGQLHWAMMSWDSISCPDVEYLAVVTGKIQNSELSLMDISSYWLPRPYFEFPMPCSTSYSYTVRARNSAGESEPSFAYSGITVPCAPQNVKYTGTLQSATFSWDASVFATKYTVYSVSGSVRDVLCTTTTLSCQVTNFDPDTIEMTASNAVGESIPTRIITGPVGRRRRRDLRGSKVISQLDNGLEIPKVLDVTGSGVSLYVKWKMVKDATEYSLVFEEVWREQQAKQKPIVRIVEGDFYIETDLKPWTTYCIRLAARNTMNQSNYSQPMCRTTGAS